MVNIPSDLRKNKETIIGNMDLRECICLFLGLLLAIGILYYIRVIIGYKRIIIAAFIAGVFVIPFLFVGFKRINGMKIDDYFKVFVNNKIISNSSRINMCPYAEQKTSNRKYELIRQYRLVDKLELTSLRQHLKDKNVLILTEYIDYQDKQYAIFRLDGKNMILERIKRNKKAIEDKKIEIKNFINNEIKIAKKEKCKNLDKQEKIEFKNNKKIKLKELSDKYKELQLHKKYLQNKTFNDLKDEVDIFEDLENVKSERILIDNKVKNNKEKVQNGTYDLREEISEDDRRIYELHLFNKMKFKNFTNNIEDKIVFINCNDEVDVLFYETMDNNSSIIGKEQYDSLVDIIELDKNDTLCKNTIKNFEARNLYNHYRSINNLEEIL